MTRHAAPTTPDHRARLQVRVIAGAAAALTVASVVGIAHDAAPRVTAAADTTTTRQVPTSQVDGRWERAVIPLIAPESVPHYDPEPITPEATPTTAERRTADVVADTPTQVRNVGTRPTTAPTLTTAPAVTTEACRCTERTDPVAETTTTATPTETAAATPTPTQPVVDEVVEDVVEDVVPVTEDETADEVAP